MMTKIAGRVARHFEVDNVGSNHKDVEGRTIDQFLREDNINGLEVGTFSTHRTPKDVTFIFSDFSQLISGDGQLQVI